MNIKKLTSLGLAFIMIVALSIVAYANPLEGTYTIKGEASASQVTAGSEFTYSLYLTEDGKETEGLAIVTDNCEWTLTFNYDKSAFSLVGTPTLNYGLADSGMSTNGDGFYSSSITSSNFETTFTADTPFITYTFKALEAATIGEKTFSASNVNFSDQSDFGAIADDNANVTKNLASVTIKSNEPAGPSVSNAAATKDGETLTDKNGKVWTGVHVWTVSADVAGQASSVSCTLTANSGAKALGTHVVAGTVKDATVTFRAAIVKVPDGTTVTLDTPVFSVQ